VVVCEHTIDNMRRGGMGIVVLSNDDSRYREGNFVVMRGEMQYPPTAPDTTYILHTKRFTEADAIRWAAIVPYRLVVILSRLPTLTAKSEEVVVIDPSLKKKKRDYRMQTEAMLRWRDRDRARPEVAKLPIPLAFAFLRVNIGDIGLWRSLSRVAFMLPDEYTHALLTYGVEPIRARVQWPKKSAKAIDMPEGCRESDIYAEQIINLSREVANEVRTKQPDALPKGVKKRRQKGIDWV